jgi:hypothetical protein
MNRTDVSDNQSYVSFSTSSSITAPAFLGFSLLFLKKKRRERMEEESGCGRKMV